MMKYYSADSNFKRAVTLIIFLLVIGVVLLILGFTLVNSELSNEEVVSNSDLFVVHSKSNFGDVIDSFDNYPTLDKAFSYSFSVENTDEMDINYDVILHNNNSNNISKISYLILKDGKDLFKGNLDDASDNILVSTKILSNSKNNYVIKFWSTDLKTKLDFRINIKKLGGVK